MVKVWWGENADITLAIQFCLVKFLEMPKAVDGATGLNDLRRAFRPAVVGFVRDVLTGILHQK